MARLWPLRSPQQAAVAQRFFKTGPGEYGAGDRFLGIRVPVLRRLARNHQGLSLKQIRELLGSHWHEERLLALLILVRQYRRKLVASAWVWNCRIAVMATFHYIRRGEFGETLGLRDSCSAIDTI